LGRGQAKPKRRGFLKSMMMDIAQNFGDDFDEETILLLECGKISENVERQV